MTPDPMDELRHAAVPLFGILGAAVTTLVAEIARYVTARRYAARASFPRLPAQRWWRPLLATAVMALTVAIVPVLHVLVDVAAGAAAYLLTLVLTGAIAYADGRIELRV